MFRYDPIFPPPLEFFTYFLFLNMAFQKKMPYSQSNLRKMKNRVKTQADTAKAKAKTAQDQKDKQTIVSSEALPRRILEESLQIAQVIRDTYAGKATS